MTRPATSTLPDLYGTDETAWLETMAELIGQGRLDELDYGHLREYLADMARRDRREVEGHLAVLIAHLLKWTHQPSHRSASWRATIVEQRQELASLFDSTVLLNHAEDALSRVYARGVERAVAETNLPRESFPGDCPDSLDELLHKDLPAD